MEVNECLIKNLENAIKEEVFVSTMLNYKRELIYKVIDKINNQEDKIKDLGINENFIKDIMTLELDRVKYYLKKYLRARLNKIEKNIFYIFQNDLVNIMTKEEFNYATAFYKLLVKNYNHSFFSKVDKKFGEIIFNNNVLENKSTNLFNKIVEPPNEDNYVFVRSIQVPQKIYIDRVEKTLTDQDVSFIQYKYIKEFISLKKSIII